MIACNRVSVRPCRASKREGRCGLTILELMVVIAILSLLLSLLLPAVQSARSAARMVTCKNRLKQIGLAVANYESIHGYLPANGIDFREQAYWSLVSFLDIGFDASEMSTRNDIERFGGYANPIWRCPDDTAEATLPGAVNFLWNDGVTTTAGDTSSGGDIVRVMGGSVPTMGVEGAVATRDFMDGLSNTALLSERLLHWTTIVPSFDHEGLTESSAMSDPKRFLWHIGEARSVLPMTGEFAVRGVQLVRDLCRQSELFATPVYPYLGNSHWTPYYGYNHADTPNSRSCLAGRMTDTTDRAYSVIGDAGLRPPTSYHPGDKVNVLFGDGRVVSAPPSVDTGVWQAAGTRAESDLLPAF